MKGLVSIKDHYRYNYEVRLDDSKRDAIVNALYNQEVRTIGDLQIVLEDIFGKDVNIRQFFPRERQATVQFYSTRFTIYWKRPYHKKSYRNNNKAENTARKIYANRNHM